MASDDIETDNAAPLKRMYVLTASMGRYRATTTASYEYRSPDAAYSSGNVSTTSGNNPYALSLPNSHVLNTSPSFSLPYS